MFYEFVQGSSIESTFVAIAIWPMAFMSRLFFEILLLIKEFDS